MMTIGIQSQHRCRICYSLIQRDRSLSYQKSFHLSKHFERRKFHLKTCFHSYPRYTKNSTVCFANLIQRYLHVQISSRIDLSNFICSDCSMILLDIEQCAKYLRKTIQQMKMKFNKSNRLRTSSLSVCLKKKKQGENVPKEKHIPITNIESDDEFEDDEEIDDDQDETKPSVSLNFIPSSSDGESFSNIQTPIKTSLTRIHQCNNNTHLQANDDDDEIGLIKSSSNLSHSNNCLSTSNGLIPTSNLLDDTTNSNLFQMHLAQLLSSTIHSNSRYSDNNNNNNNNNQSMMSAFASMQKNLFMQLINDSTVATQPVTSTPMKTNLISTNNKQISTGRKRKSTPEKRTISNHQLSNINNDDISLTTIEHDSSDPLELTTKSSHTNNRVLTSSLSNIQNLMTNGSSIDCQMFDENKETFQSNESSLSPSLTRRTTSNKRTKSSSDYPHKLKIHISSTSPSSNTHLLSPNQQSTSPDHQQQKQQKKLDPRPCAECGKTLFSDKTHLLHCQTHAINEKQCWICGIQDDEIKKHIVNEHGNQKFTNAGFKCEHCEKIFPAYADLQTHMKDHNKKKPFECPICNKRFGQQGNLSCHLRIHSGVKPFTCAHCGKAFRHSNSLRRHARTVHSASRVLPLDSRPTNSIASSLLATTSNSMVSMANDYHRTDVYDDNPDGLMITSDDGESMQSTADLPSPSISNAQNDSDSHEQYGTS